MKHNLLLAAFLLCAWQASSQDAEGTHKTVFGLKSGVNVSIFSASVNSESSFRTGFHIGVYVKSHMSNNWYFRPELYYSGQGQKDDWQTPPNGPSVGNTTTTVNYLNVPLLFETGKKVSFQFGPQIGIFLSGTEQGTINNQKVDGDLKEEFKPIDLSLVLGLSVNPTENFNFGLRLNNGLTDIYTADPDYPGIEYPPIKNRVFHFYVGFSF